MLFRSRRHTSSPLQQHGHRPFLHRWSLRLQFLRFRSKLLLPTFHVNLLYFDADKARSVEEKLNGQKNASSSIAFDAGSITRRMIASLSDNFNYVLYICGLIVFVFLLFSLGRLELTLIAFTPLALSWVWILGLMGLFDIKFNIVNIILATFIFGQGDDYTIFMTEGLMIEIGRASCRERV